jgi:soluble lytic murein transglycosylase-like protein
VRTSILLGALLCGGAASQASGDTLYLRAGKSLKIEALSCNATACVATIKGGDIEVRAIDVDRVEPDEPVDVEPVPPVSPAVSSTEVQARRTIEEMVADAAHKYALPRSLVRAVARAESALDPNAVSAKGAQGVMQLMPGTARELGVENALDPAQNIDAGARLLRQLLEKYDGRVAEALAAYNAGQGAVAKHNGVPPYRETRGYIRKVVKDFEKAEKQSTAAKGAEKKP